MFTEATSSKESKKRETTPARKLYCAFYDGEHLPTDCTIVKKLDQRYEVAKTKRLCFNCLRKCHAAGTECPSSFGAVTRIVGQAWSAVILSLSLHVALISWSIWLLSLSQDSYGRENLLLASCIFFYRRMFLIFADSSRFASSIL